MFQSVKRTKSHVLLLFLIVISILIPAASAGTITSQISITYNGSWRGTVGVDGNSYTVEGSGDKTYEMEGRNVVAQIGKQDNSSNPLTLRILRKGVEYKNETTTAANGVVRVNHWFPAKGSGDDDEGGCCCLIIILLLVILLIFIIKRYKKVQFRKPWVPCEAVNDRTHAPETGPVARPATPPPGELDSKGT